MRIVQQVPGVTAAAGSLLTPVSGAATNRVIDVPGTSPMPPSDRVVVVNFVTPGWFSVYSTALRFGRDIDARDTASAPPVAVVNDAFVRRFLPGRDPLGTLLVAPAPGRRDPQKPKTIVGVVGDAVYRSLREPVQPTMYLPLAQWDFVPAFGGGSISVRSASIAPSSLAHDIATALSGFNLDLAFSLRLLTDQVDASLTQERLVAMVAGFFGALALLLAGLGLYGVTSYAVSRRRTEIGIRMALGAEPSSVVRLVLARVTILVGLGVIVGATLSMWASKFVARLLYGMEPRDPVTLVVATIVLASVSALAGWLPARRASQIDPSEVLRDS
jgi:putative ABC transport system permease protein